MGSYPHISCWLHIFSEKKKYLKDGYKECDEDGKVKKAKKAKKK